MRDLKIYIFEESSSCEVDIIPVVGMIHKQKGQLVKTPQWEQPTPQYAKELVMLEQLPATHQVKLSVVFKDSKGNVAKVEGKPVWTTDNSEVLALVPGEDGLSCLVKAAGPLSETPTTVTMTADADLGEGVKALVGTFVVNKVTAGEAVVVEVVTGPIEPQV